MHPDLLGHERPLSVLRSAVRSGRTHHAWLFSGPDGVGKRKIALAFAQALNCLDPDDAGNPCQTCRSCVKISGGLHPDVTLLEPDRSKARWVLKIESVREITRQVNFKPYEGRRRVIVIDDAHTVTIEGANAFLKTLEEPTGDTLFVLLTAQPRRLLTTIRSRCQSLRFAPLPDAIVQTLLIRQGVDPALAEVAARFAEGSVTRGLLIGQEGVLATRRALIEDVLGLRDAGTLAVFDKAGELSRTSPEELRAQLDFLKVFLRDVVLTATHADPERIANRDMSDLVRRTATRLTIPDAIRHIDRIASVQDGLQGYVDARLLLEDLLFQIAGASPNPA